MVTNNSASTTRPFNGPFIDYKHPTSSPPNNIAGSSFRIGDGYFLTAAHLVFEFNQQTDPALRAIYADPRLLLDHFDYSVRYLQEAMNYDTSLTFLDSHGNVQDATNNWIESRGGFALSGRDSALVTGSGSVDKNDPGMAVFLAPADLTDIGTTFGTDLNRYYNSVLIGSGSTAGMITRLTGSGAGFEFSVGSQGSESGGAYTFQFDDRYFYVGTQSTTRDPNNSSLPAFGVYITRGYFDAISAVIGGGYTGNVTESEPTNLIVGSNAGDATVNGSFRADIILGRGGQETLVGDLAASPAWGNDQLFGGADNDTARGGRGFDLLHGGDWRAYGGSRVAIEDDGTDITDYADQTKAVKIKLIPTGEGDQTFAIIAATDFGSAVFVETTADTYMEGSTQKATTDTLISIEKILGSDHKDTVYIKALTATPLAGADGTGGLAEIDLKGETAAPGDSEPDGDHIDLSDMEAAVKVDLAGGRVELKSDSSIGLKVLEAERVTGGEGDDELRGNTKGNTIIGGDGEDTIFGGATAGPVAESDVLKYTDTLEGGDGKDTITGGGDYNIIRGGEGDDTLIAAGREGHLYGGPGNDTFKVGSNTWVEEVTGKDTIDYGGIELYGGVKQWWMEGNKAYWSPFSTLLTAFPVIGSEILYTASFFIDVATMKFATYQLDASGNLQMNLGWGQAGTAAIRNYELDLDSGLGSAGVAVFQADRGGGSSGGESGGGRVTQFVNLALKAGFGVGFNGFDPLVLDLDGDGYELTTEANSRAYFEFDSDGFGERTGWVRGDDGLLARDANGNGKVDHVGELFGNQTTSGFTMLGAHDLNADGVIDAGDAVFSELRVWRDADQDGVTDAGELKTLAELGIVSISLANAAPAQPTAIGGNAIVRTGTFGRSDGTSGAVADVAFAINETASRWLGDSTVSAAAAALPQLKGYGELKDLRVAMTGDAALLAMVADFADETMNDLVALEAAAEAILYKWAGVEAVAADPLGSNGFDSRKLAFLEQYSGYQMMPRGAGGAVQLTNLAEMEELWADQVTRLTLRLVVQGPMADEFSGISYRPDLDLLVADTATALQDLYGGLLGGLPADAAAAFAQWQSWAPLLGAMADGMRRFDANMVRGDYVAAQLLAAMEGVAQPLDFAELAGALGIANLRIGTPGADTLSRGSASATVLYAPGGGADLLDGGSGQDVYMIGETVGQIVIDDEEARPAGDRIRFAFLEPGDVTMARSGNDLLITVNATGETVRVVGQFAPVVPLSSDVLLSSNKGVEEIQFADGSIYEIPEIMTAVGAGSDGDDVMTGTMHSDVLIGGLGDDLLKGGDDADLYVVRAGEGHDIIREIQSTPLLRAADLLIFGEGIAPGDLSFSRLDGGDDLLVTIGAAGQTLLIDEQFAYSVLGYNDKLAPNSRIEAFAFSDHGDSWGIRDLQQRLIAEQTTDGDDDALGFGDDDLFGASPGDDHMTGLDGADRYRWGAGSGHDVIDEKGRFVDVTVGMMGLSLTVEADTVEFGPGIVASGIDFSRPSSSPHLLVTLLATGETLTVRNQFDGFQTGPLGAQWLDRIEWFKFADGSRLSWQQVLLDTTTGGAGDDSLWGDLYTDTLDGGAGDDRLSGLGLADTYVFKLGYGHDTLVDNNQSILGGGFVTVDTTPDVLRFGPGIAPTDIGFERSGKDLILVVGAGGDRVTLEDQDDYFHTGVFGAVAYDRIEEIRFDDGTLWTWQQLNARVLALSTTPGNDVAQGFMMSDRFEASAGNDVMSGGDSSDTYVFGPGSGHDIVRESVSNVLYGDTDIVEFVAGVLPSGVALARDGEDLILTLVATGDTLTVDGEFRYSNWFEWWDVNRFVFSDGTVWTKQDVQVRLLQPTAGDDELVGFMTGDTLDGGAGDDVLRGGDGPDTYLFGTGSGHDIIRETVTNANLADNDRLVFGAGILPADVAYARDGDDLVITLAGGDTLRVDGQFSFTNWFAWWDVEKFEFADGTILTDRDVANEIMGGTPGDDHIVGTFRSDVLDGGAGNDLLEGGDGADRYVFGPGYGQDEIRESLSNANLSEDDQLQFLPGITLADLGFERVGKDLVITLLGTSDSLTIIDEFRYSNWFTWWDVDRFAFADGTALSKVDVQQMLLAPTAGDDHLVGFMTGDTLDGAAGNDLLEGGDGGDTYLFGRGYGQDEIRETLGNANLSEHDTLRFAPDVAWSDLLFSRSGDRLTITIAGTSDSISIADQFQTINDASTATWWDVEAFAFADGTSKSIADIMAEMDKGTPGDDVLVGYYGADTFIGGAGNDLLKGARGADTYVHNAGDGHDVVSDYVDYWGSSGDRVLFGPGIAPSDVAVTRAAARPGDMVLTVGNGESSVTLTNQITGGREWTIDKVQFADGTIWTEEQLAEILMEGAGTEGDDVIDGTAFADEIDGGAGNDTLRGLDGGDTLEGGSGNDILEGGSDQDSIAGGTGDDTIDGGSETDTYSYALGDGHDKITDYGEGGALDPLVFGPEITPEMLHFATSPTDTDNIVISFAGHDGSVLLDEKAKSEHYGPNQLVFADGQVWSESQILAAFVASLPTAGADVIHATYAADTISGGAGNDVVHGLGGGDQITGGAGNDRLEGGEGADIYHYAAGDGDDSIYDYGGTRTNRILLGAGITPAETTVEKAVDDTRDLILRFAGGGSIRLDNQSWSDAGVEYVEFADATVWNESQLNALVIAGQQSPGNDIMTGTSGSDWIEGLGGNDTISGLGGQDTLVGGIGDDVLDGGEEADTFLYDLGDGYDRIYDYGTGGALDTLLLGAGITAAMLRLGISASDADDVVVTFDGQAGSVTLDEKAKSDSYGPNQIALADGTILSEAQMLAGFIASQVSGVNDVVQGTYAADLIEAGAGNDTIYGKDGQDVITGGPGDDTIDGGEETDTFHYALGDGNDTIYDYGTGGAVDTLRFAAGIDASMLLFDVSVTDADDIVVTFAGHAGSVLLNEKAKSDDYGPNRILFDDGTALSEAQLLAAFAAGQRTEGNDVIQGSYAADLIEGGAGNDTIYGKAGGDRIIGGLGDDVIDGGDQTDYFVYNLGDGNDRLYDYGTGGAVDMLEFGANITPTLLRFATASDIDDIVISFAGWSGSVTLDEKAASDDYGPNAVKFADATVWSEAQLLAAYVAGLGSSAVETIQGTYAADTIKGFEGDDSLFGRGGNDRFEVGAGEGFDAVDGGSGTDTIAATANGVAIGLRSLTAVETITANGFSDVTVQGSAAADTLNFTSVTLTNIVRVDGGGGNDTLTGNTAANTIWGGAGDDVIKGAAGNDSVDGGLGSDKAQFAGNKSTYSIVTSGGTVQVVDNAPTADGNDGTDTVSGIEQLQFKDQTISITSPIVLDLDGDGLELVDLARSNARFDFDGDGNRDHTGWIGKGDGLLVYDRDGNGTVSGADELSFTGDWPGAKSDLDGLRAFDSNDDGLFSAADEAWAEFRVWRDRDLDGAVDKGELLSMRAAGVASISLTGTPTERSWEWGENIIINHGQFSRTNGKTGLLGDVALTYERGAAPASAFAASDEDGLDLPLSLQPFRFWANDADLATLSPLL